MSDSIVRLNAALEGLYHIERELGEGGMATVYLADDLKHKRHVALKILKPELAAVVGADRFVAEIETTANLQHPHILPLFDSGEADGHPFYVMPYIAGESLQDRLQREGPLPLEDALRIASECGGALEYAHRQGVIHRDVKPANILLSDGHAVVADFGIARAVQEAAGREALTATGVAVGTVGYMSPEQASGEREVDARADVYALGCVLYEMLAGEQPFHGATPYAVMARQFEGPEPVTKVRRSVPESVETVIQKACEPTPGDRFGSAEEFVRGLLDDGARSAARGRGSRSVKRGLVAAVVAVIAAVVWLGVSWPFFGPAPVVADERPVLAVLPFENLSPAEENAFFADGVHQDVLTHLSKIGELMVLARPAVLRYRDTDKSTGEIAAELGADAVLRASVRRAGDQVRIDVQLIDPSTEGTLWAESYTEHLDAENVFAVQTDVARRAALALQVTLSPKEEARIAARPTEIFAAYDLYMKGREAYDRRTVEDNIEAVRLYRGALGLDPEYAQAWAGLGDAFAQRVWGLSYPLAWADTAVQYAERAVALEPELAYGHKALGVAYSVQERRQISLEASYRAAVLDPNQMEAANNIGFELRDAGRFREALPWLHRALRLVPNHPVPLLNLAKAYSELLMDSVSGEWLTNVMLLDQEDVNVRIHGAHRERGLGNGEGAIVLAEEVVRDAPDAARALMLAAEVAYLARDFERAVTWVREAIRVAPNNIQRNSWYGTRALLGLSLMAADDVVAGRDALQESMDYYRRRIDQGAEFWLFPWGIGTAHAALGEDEAALPWLEQAYDAGFRLVRLAQAEPALDGLRDDPRFEEWMARMEADVAAMRERVIEEERAAGNQ